MNNLVSEFQSSLRRKGSYWSQKEALEIHSMNCSFAEKGLFYSSVVGFGVINDLQWGELDKLTNGASPDDKRDGMKYHFTWHCHCEETSASFHGSHCSILEPTVKIPRKQSQLCTTPQINWLTSWIKMTHFCCSSWVWRRLVFNHLPHNIHHFTSAISFNHHCSAMIRLVYSAFLKPNDG